jgi:hypothetical protein
VGLNSEDSSYEWNNDAEEAEDVEPAADVLPGKHHKDP